MNNVRGLTRIPTDEINLWLVSDSGDAVNLESAKLAIKGDKYIGMQQDSFTIVTYNIPPYLLADWVQKQEKNKVVVAVNRVPVFSGVITNLTSGSPDIVNYEVIMTCLTKTTTFLTSLVRPYSLPSSMNAYNMLKWMVGDGIEVPKELENVYIDNDLHVSGNAKSDIEHLVESINSKLPGTNWIDIKYHDDRIQLFSSGTKVEQIYKIDHESGLINVPTLSENGLSFNHIFRGELIPGTVIRIDNATLSTLGTNTAFLYTMDPNHNYVITHVSYNFQNYQGKELLLEIEAYPYSKFKNWSVK